MTTGIPATPTTGTIVSVLAGTPDAVYTVPASEAPEGFPTGRAMVLTGITLTGTQAAGSGAQAHVGVLKNGAAAWDGELISPIIDGGAFTRWSGALRLETGDQVQAYASITARIDITLELSSA